MARFLNQGQKVRMTLIEPRSGGEERLLCFQMGAPFQRLEQEMRKAIWKGTLLNLMGVYRLISGQVRQNRMFNPVEDGLLHGAPWS